MNKVFIVFCLSLLPFAFVYAQTEVDTIQTELESDCEANLESIFKVYDLKRKYDIVEHIYKESRQKKVFCFLITTIGI